MCSWWHHSATGVEGSRETADEVREEAAEDVDEEGMDFGFDRSEGP